MIRVEIKTVMEFSDEKEFFNYTNSHDVGRITGFAEEMRQAYKTKAFVKYKTINPIFGRLVVSNITARDAQVICTCCHACRSTCEFCEAGHG